MDKVSQFMCCLMVTLLLSEHSFGRGRYRSRARHIMVRYPIYERTSSNPMAATRQELTTSVPYITTRPHSSASSISMSHLTTIESRRGSTESYLSTQISQLQGVTPVSNSRVSTPRTTRGNWITTVGALPEDLPPQSSDNREQEPSRRRGSQAPEESYSVSEWDLIQQRIANPPPISTTRHPTRYTFPVRRGGQYNQNQNGQDNDQNHGQQQGQPSPFIPKMSAFDYLTRRANNNILYSRNNQRNREISREMGEGMCEAFNKHYVSISIGGRCV